MGMKPSVSDDGSIQKQIGSAYDVVKSVADNLPAILAVTSAVENAQEVIADITEQVELATTAANNASTVVGTIENLKQDTIVAKDLAEDYRDDALVVKGDVIAIRDTLAPQLTDFNTKYGTFNINYNDSVTKYGQIVGMHDDVDADRIAAETARTKAEKWASEAVDVIVETGKYSAMHWATKASGFNTLAQGYASTANQRAIDANQSAIDAAASVVEASGHVTAASNHVTSASNFATTASNHAGTALGHANTALGHANTASGHVSTALGHANTALGYKDLAFDYKEEAKAYRDQAGAIVGGNFVPNTTTVNGLALTGNITLTAAQLTDLVPKTTTVNSKALTGNIVLGVSDISGAARTDGTNATGTWPITASKANTLSKILQTQDTGASNAAMYMKLLRVTLGTRYHEYTALLAVLLGNSGSGTPSTELLTLRVKQQNDFGSNPNIDCQSMVLVTPYNGVVYGYTIVQNTPTTIVDFYIQINNSWTGADISVLQEKMSGTEASRTWYNLSAFEASVAGFVAGTRTYLVRTTDTTNKVLWANVTPATSISNLQTQLENANLGYLRKTAASTYVVETTVPLTSTSGTLAVNRGGTGVITLTGLVKGNGTGAFTAAVAGTDYVIPSGSITGNAANVTGTVAVANGGTGATTVSAARINLGATTVGANLFTLTNPSAITFMRVNADNTISTLDAASFRAAIGAGSGGGSVTSVTGTGTVSGLTLSGTVTTSGNITLGGTLSVAASNFASQSANTLLIAPNGAAGVPTFRGLVAADIPNLDWSKITTGVPTFALQSDARFTDSREWTAATAVLADITGSDTTRKAYTGAVIKAAIDDIAAPKTSTNSRLTALETAPDSGVLARKALAIAIMGL